MEQMQIELHQLVRTFTAQVTELARREALQRLRGAFEPHGRLAASMRRGVKRAPSDIEAIAARLVGFVKAHPGLRIEQINKQLGTRTRDLALPMRRLVAAGSIRTQGQKRATIYFVER